jgi:hypothetical protein
MQKIKDIEDRVRPILGEKTEEKLYIYYRYRNMEEYKTKYFRKYRTTVRTTRDIIAEVYENLAIELKKYNAKVLDIKGDYLFVQADESIKDSKLVYVVRELPIYEVKRPKRKDKNMPGLGDLFEFAEMQKNAACESEEKQHF